MRENTVVINHHDQKIRACHEEILNDAQWFVIEQFFPEKHGVGRNRKHSVRQIVEAILFVLRTGCQWRHLPSGYPPKSTGYWWFMQWNFSGLIDRISHRMVMADRERMGREASPTAAVIDSHSVKTTCAGGESGYD